MVPNRKGGTMARKRSTTTAVKRDPKTGRFVPDTDPRKRRSAVLTEAIRAGIKRKSRA